MRLEPVSRKMPSQQVTRWMEESTMQVEILRVKRCWGNVVLTLMKMEVRSFVLIKLLDENGKKHVKA